MKIFNENYYLFPYIPFSNANYQFSCIFVPVLLTVKCAIVSLALSLPRSYAMPTNGLNLPKKVLVILLKLLLPFP